MKNKYEIKVCSDCGNKRVQVIIGEKGLWACPCGWKGTNPTIQILSPKEYLQFAEEELE